MAVNKRKLGCRQFALLTSSTDGDPRGFPTGTIDAFLHSLDGKVKRKKLLSIEHVNRITAAGQARNLDQVRRSLLIQTCLCGPC
jgi:hypothetical protein